MWCRASSIKGRVIQRNVFKTRRCGVDEREFSRGNYMKFVLGLIVAGVLSFILWLSIGRGADPGRSMGKQAVESNSSERVGGRGAEGSDEYSGTLLDMSWLDGVTSEFEFSELWDDVLAENQDERVKTLKLGFLVGRMVSLGEEEAALQMIQGRTGPGKRRSDLISKAFIAMRESLTVTKVHSLFELLTSEKDLASARKGLASGLSMTGMTVSEFLAFDAKGLGKDPAFQHDFLENRLYLCSAKNSGRPGGVEGFMEELSLGIQTGQLQREVALEIFKNVSVVSPFRAAEVFEPLFLESNSDIDLSEMALWMAATDGDRAVRYFMDHEGFDTQGKYAGIAFRRWLGEDVEEATDWLHTLRQSGGEKVQTLAVDQMIAAVAAASMHEKEFDTAREWVNEVRDPNVREQLEGQVWSLEKKVVDQAVGRDPAGMLNEIVSGESRYAEYWIKNAFGTWASKSQEAASAWYDENRTSLTPSQNQHVARVFVEQAVKNGDFQLAKQWLGQVVDEGFRDPLETMIGKALEKAHQD